MLRLIVFLVCFLPFSAYAVMDSDSKAQCFPTVSFLTLGQSAFFHPESRKFDHQGPLLPDMNCVPVSIGTLSFSVDKLVNFDQSNPTCIRCFINALTNAEENLTIFAKLRCAYNYGRRLIKLGTFSPGAKQSVVNSLGGALLESTPKIVSRIDTILKDIDRFFSTYFGLDGWYTTYGLKILSNINKYSDMDLR
jgi:hypothetical protein